MKTESDSGTLTVPHALLAEIQAQADEEHRPATEVLQDAVTRYVREKHPRVVRKVSEMSAAEVEAIADSQMDPRHNPLDALLDSPELTAAQAVARIFELRKGNDLADGVTLRDLMTHGRA